MSDEGRVIAREALFEAVDNQVREGDPPVTRRTLQRLQREGFSREDARGLIGEVLAAEMAEIVAKQREFDLQRYTEALEALPTELHYDEELGE